VFVEQPSLLCFQVLRSDEGRQLRFRHQEAVRYLRERLVDAGIPALHCPSHIIPVHVSIFVLPSWLFKDVMHFLFIYAVFKLNKALPYLISQLAFCWFVCR